MRQTFGVVIFSSLWGESRRWQGWVWLLQDSQDCQGVGRNPIEGHLCFKKVFLWKKLHLLQTRSSCSGGGGAGAGVERVSLWAVCQSFLLQLQVTSQGVNLMNNLVTSRRSVTVTAQVKVNKFMWQLGMRLGNITNNNLSCKENQEKRKQGCGREQNKFYHKIVWSSLRKH